MSKRKQLSERPPDGIFGTNARWIHGGRGTPEYSAYTTAKTLCANPKNPRWLLYGGRGIEFRLPSFAEFLQHLGRASSREDIGPHQPRRPLRHRQRALDHSLQERQKS
jgi:hypothetical protein